MNAVYYSLTSQCNIWKVLGKYLSSSNPIYCSSALTVGTHFGIFTFECCVFISNVCLHAELQRPCSIQSEYITGEAQYKVTSITQRESGSGPVGSWVLELLEFHHFCLVLVAFFGHSAAFMMLV